MSEDGHVQQLITEVITESATAEIALWVIGVSATMLAAAIIAPWWLGRHGDDRADSWSFPVLRVAAVLGLFAILTRQIQCSGWLIGADQVTLTWLTTHRSPAITTIVVAVTHLGSPAGVAAIGIASGALWSWRRHSLIPLAVILGTLTLTAVANTVIKNAFARPRPPLSSHLVDAAGFSYPSGHTAGTAALAGALLMIYLPASTTALRQVLAVACAVCATVAVATSRLYLGVHWLTDVAGATLLGCAIVLAVAVALAAARRGSETKAAGTQRDDSTDHRTMLPPAKI